MTQTRLKTFVTRPERRPVALRGFALGDGRDADVQVADLSYGGCQIHSTDQFRTGELLELRIIKRGVVDAQIRWTANGRAGASFIN